MTWLAAVRAIGKALELPAKYSPSRGWLEWAGGAYDPVVVDGTGDKGRLLVMTREGVHDTPLSLVGGIRRDDSGLVRVSFLDSEPDMVLWERRKT